MRTGKSPSSSSAWKIESGGEFEPPGREARKAENLVTGRKLVAVRKDLCVMAVESRLGLIWIADLIN